MSANNASRSIGAGTHASEPLYCGTAHTSRSGAREPFGLVGSFQYGHAGLFGAVDAHHHHVFHRLVPRTSPVRL